MAKDEVSPHLRDPEQGIYTSAHVVEYISDMLDGLIGLASQSELNSTANILRLAQKAMQYSNEDATRGDLN